MSQETPSPGRQVRLRLGAAAAALIIAGGAAVLAVRSRKQAVLQPKAFQEQQNVFELNRRIHVQLLAYQRMLESVLKDEGFLSMDVVKQEKLLARLMKESPAFLELSVADAKGKENVRTSRRVGSAPELRELKSQPSFMQAMEGNPYMGVSYDPNIYTVALPIPGAKGPKGVLFALVSAAGVT